MAAAAASSNLPTTVVPPSVAPIDIQLPKVTVSTAVPTGGAAAVATGITAATTAVVATGTGESLGGDSGYESSWPSLSEAAAWSSAQSGARKAGTRSSHLHAHHHHHTHHRHSYANSPTASSSPDLSGSSSGGGPGATMLHQYHHHHYHHHHQRQPSNNASQHQYPLKPPSGGKKVKHRRRKAQQAMSFQALDQHFLEPLVDFGSPLMDEVDEVPPQDASIPLSAIPRRWLYEEDEASGDDDVLVTVPKREWVYCSNSTLSMDAKSFVVMTWNLLSPRLCHPLHLHYRCDQTHLEWNTRRETILNQIVFTDADIICLQEIEKQDFDEYFEPQLARLGYKSIHAYKTNLYEIRDGCALFYRDSRFKLNDHHILRYNQTDLDDEMRPSMARDTAIRFNLFHNLAIVALLENRRTHRLVQVATTHLLADPAYPDAKMLQSAILVSKLEELKAKALVEYGHCGYPATHTAHQHSHTHHCYHPAYYRPMARPDNKHTRTSSSSSSSMPAPFRPCPALDIPTIIAGDLNSLPHSSVISFLKTGRVETSHFGGYDFGRFTRRSHKYLHHSLELSDCYKDSTLPYTNITRNFEGTIDYMLFAKKSLSLIGFLDHLERPTTASSSSTTESNKSAGAKGNGNRSKKTKKMTVKFKKESEEKSLSLNRRGSTHSLQFALHDIGDADDYNNHDNGDHVDDVGHFRGEVSDSEEPATMSDSHGGELSGLGDDDSSGSDADQEDMHIGLRSSSSFTPTTIWSSLTPLQQQRLTLASRTFSSTTQPINKTSAVKARREATKTHSGTTTCAATTRYPLPTMPSQYFPSDHIPLAAVFKERDMTVCCCSQSCRRRTDDPKL